MARFQLSASDLLSPINSDISLNDASVSVFSFGSLPETPLFDTIASPICSISEKDLGTSPLCTKTMKGCANVFDDITDNAKKQLCINSEKEEKYKETFEILKKSMDDLFSGNDLNSSVSPPHLMNNEFKNEIFKPQVPSKENAVGEFEDCKHLKIHKKNTDCDTENISETVERKDKKCKKGTSVINAPKKKQQLSKSSSSESVKSTKNKNEVCIRKDAGVNKMKDALINQKEKPKLTSKNDETLSAKSSKVLLEKSKEAENVKKYDFKCEKKIPTSNDVPIIEQKNLSIEKPIQLAVSMEMDNIRRFVLDQNLYMHKDLLKLQEMVKKQNEVTEYLFSVIDELLDENKKLISKCK